MYANISTIAFEGIEARAVDVQVQIGPGLPSFTIVGLADKAVAESRERVRSALNAIGLGLPAKRITVNLAPADLPKEGSHYDLPIALGLMAASGALSPEQLQDYCAVGELALDGALSPILGGLPAAIGASALGKGLICPESSGAEAAWASQDMNILAPAHILELVNHFKGSQILSRPEPALSEERDETLDLQEIKGQESAKRALEVAAAGGHNILLVGPPGSGKSMLAQRLPSILPPLNPKEMLDVSMIQSMAGELAGGRLGRSRPFRAPHHSASMVALVGGGSKPKPGEVALAHLGVLFLDELPEFSPQVLDSLRQPLETGQSIIARANHRITYPSRIQLIAAMNPCKCGRAFEPGFSCRSGKNCADRYLSRLSGPLLDRIDLQIEVPAVSIFDLTLPVPKEGSQEVRQRVIRARQLQTDRFEVLEDHHKGQSLETNANCSVSRLEQIANINADGKSLFQEAANLMKLSARGYHRTIRVARTIADLGGEESVSRDHIAEALSYRGESLHQR